VCKELLKGLTEVVQARLAVGCLAETVLGAATVAGEAPLARLTLTRQAVAFGTSELLLPLAVHHSRDGIVVDIA